MVDEPAPLPLERLYQVLPRIFGAPDEAVLREVAARLTWRTLERGEHLFRAGAPGDALFVVVSGRLVARGVDEAGRPWVSGAMNAGATVGELSVLTDSPRSADVVAVRRSEVVRLSRADFAAVVASHPGFLLHVSQGIAERLRRAEPARGG